MKDSFPVVDAFEPKKPVMENALQMKRSMGDWAAPLTQEPVYVSEVGGAGVLVVLVFLLLLMLALIWYVQPPPPIVPPKVQE